MQIVQEQQKVNKDLEAKKLESFTNQNQQIQDRYNSISENLEKFVNTFNENSQSKANDREGETNTLHQTSVDKIQEETNTIKESFKSKVQQTTDKHKKEYKEHHEDLKNTSHEFLQEIENDTITFLQSTRDNSINRTKENITLLKSKTDFVRTVHDHYAKDVEKANSTAGQLRNELIGTVNTQYDTLIKGNQGFSEELQTTITSGLEVLTPKITIMEDFERIVKEFQFPTVTSLPLIGSGAALHTLDYYLSDFKASVTLLIPNPKDIPMKMISETKRPKRVTVASMFDLDNPQEKDLVKKLIEQDNVTVRRLEPEQYRGTGGVGDTGYPLYMAADRDAEEIFIGAYDFENKAEFAGMVSQNHSFISFLGKVVLSDFLTRARKIDKI
jgi:hypothetical protein